MGAGTHRTLLIRTDSTWGLEATVRTLARPPPDLPAGAPVEEEPDPGLPTAVPPGLTPALAPAGPASRYSSAAASVAAWNLNGLTEPELATKIPSRLLGSVRGGGVRD